MKKSLFILCAAFSLSACSIFFPEPYKVAVTQGNLVTQEQLSQLQVGMSESQVTYLLGTPMVQDNFKPDEWHYLYTVLHAAADTQQSEVDNLTLIFNNGTLAEIKNH